MTYAEDWTTHEAIVVYQDTNNKVWCRSAEEWVERVGPRRFEKRGYQSMEQESRQ